MTQMMPEDMAQIIADLNRRIGILEATARAGLNLLRFCEATASAVPSTFGTAEYGTVGNTWLNDKGQTGTGYPTLTMTLPSRSLAIFHCVPLDIGNAAGFRSTGASFHLKMDSNPFQFLFTYTGQSNIDRMYTPVIGVGILNQPGLHTFTMGATWANSNPGGATLPSMDLAKLYIIPTSAV